MIVCYVEPTVYTNSYYGDGDGAIVYYNTTCKGYESSIIECSKQTYSTFTCSRSNVVGIACQEGTSSSNVVTADVLP
jgi:deleted-in-malignant-brain-tumors protein 1